MKDWSLRGCVGTGKVECRPLSEMEVAAHPPEGNVKCEFLFPVGVVLGAGQPFAHGGLNAAWPVESVVCEQEEGVGES